MSMAHGGMEMTFAEKQLAKYGWKKGMGLGKMNDGISEPIKVKTCKNNLGIGNDPKRHLSHWWDMAYNRAVNNITVERSENGNIEVKSRSECSITQEKPNVFNSNVLYDDFQQAGTLKRMQFTSNDKCCAGSDCIDSEDESRGISRGQGLLLDMTDAELLKLCGGGTAHKGARHGLRMGGKMKRLKAMEEADAARATQRRHAQLGTASESVICHGSGYENDVVADGKRNESYSDDKQGENTIGQENCEAEVPKKKKKKKSKKENSFDCNQIEICVRSKTDNQPKIEGDEDPATELKSDEPRTKHKRKKRRRNENDGNALLNDEMSVKSPIVPQENKKKKKKRKHCKENVDEEKESQQTRRDSSAKLEKKMKKNRGKSSDTTNKSEENVDGKLYQQSRADNAGADMPVILGVDQSSEEIRQNERKRKKQIHAHHA